MNNNGRIIRTVNITIDTDEALRLLCQTLDMSFVLDEDETFFIQKDSDGNNCVYQTSNGYSYLFDDRGDLFIALRNVAVQIFPNLLFRNEPYIYK